MLIEILACLCGGKIIIIINITETIGLLRRLEALIRIPTETIGLLRSLEALNISDLL